MADLLTLAGEHLADPWQLLDDDSPLPGEGDIVISLARWEADSDSLQNHHGRVGVELPNTLDAMDVPQALLQVDMIALRFPAFTDGRAYSQARQLRERRHYSGLIRACGDVLHDQLFYMSRCGFDLFELPSNLDESQLKLALSTFSQAYQPTRSGPQLSRAGVIQ